MTRSLIRPRPADQLRCPFLIETKLAISIRPVPGPESTEPTMETTAAVEAVEAVEAESSLACHPPVPGKTFLPFQRRFGDLVAENGKGAFIVPPSLQGLAAGGNLLLLPPYRKT